MNLRIYAMTHKAFDVPKDPLYLPLHVGHVNAKDLGYPGDDVGENISHLNCYYSELTGHYWLWKNCKDVDYIGTCHYRRYLINEQEKVLTKNEYENLLKDYNLVTTKRVILNNSYHYGFSANHNINALDCTGEVIRDLYPEYYDAFITLVHQNETYFGNMFVTSKALFDQYCEWLFTIFAEVEKRIDLDTDEDAYHKRVLGFISEFLLLVWVRVNNLKVYECKVGMLGEKAETRELKETLAEYFRKKDIQGAMQYFMQMKTARPDVMMEASDVTGELRICMQIIATAGKEQAVYGQSVLDRECEFRKLIALFTELNNVIYRKHHGMSVNEPRKVERALGEQGNETTSFACGTMSQEDELFLKEKQISDVALEVAEAVYAAVTRAEADAPEFFEHRNRK